MCSHWIHFSLKYTTSPFFRYYLVQKAKEARTVGILVGTLGAGVSLLIPLHVQGVNRCVVYIYTAEYLEIIERLKKILKQAGKKVEMLSMDIPLLYTWEKGMDTTLPFMKLKK